MPTDTEICLYIFLFAAEYTLFLRYSLNDKCGQTVQRPCSKNYIDIRVAALYLIGNSLLLHHAAAESYHHIRALLLYLFESAYIAKNPVLSAFSYSAGVKQNKIGINT